MKKGKKISIIGAGNVGATIAYTIALEGLCSEMVLVDINEEKARGEAMDIEHGMPLSYPLNIYSGSYSDMADSDIVIMTPGAARRPGESRIDLARGNVKIVKYAVKNAVRYAPDSIYIAVSNPVDIVTYAMIKASGLPASHVIGSGTLLDSSRLKSKIAKHIGMSTQNVHAYVLGEHGDSSVIPWSLTSIAGMSMTEYCTYICREHNECGKGDIAEIERDVRSAGAEVISLKGATYYAIGVTAKRICECIIRDTKAALTVSGMLSGEYGISNICMSLPFIVGAGGIEGCINPRLTDREEGELVKSAESLKKIILTLDI